MTTTTIQLRELYSENNTFNLTLSFRYSDGNIEEIKATLLNPYNEKSNELLEYYFEEYLRKPYDDIPIQEAPKIIEEYGINLFQQLFVGEAYFYYRTALQQAAPENIIFEIIGKTPTFQAIYWETIRDPKLHHPLIAKGVIFRRKNVASKTVRAAVNPSPTINLLIVTARPKEEKDVNYRTIQRPIISLIQKAKLKVKAHILRPGTFEAFVKHLDEIGAKHYHIIHFDLHGALLDFTTYQAFNKKIPHHIFTNLSFQNLDFNSSYALPELPEFSNKKAFLFFESIEKGIPIPVEAGQLGILLETMQIPIVLLNACQSAKQEHGDAETSLVFIK